MSIDTSKGTRANIPTLLQHAKDTLQAKTANERIWEDTCSDYVVDAWRQLGLHVRSRQYYPGSNLRM